MSIFEEEYSKLIKTRKPVSVRQNHILQPKDKIVLAKLDRERTKGDLMVATGLSQYNIDLIVYRLLENKLITMDRAFGINIYKAAAPRT